MLSAALYFLCLGTLAALALLAYARDVARCEGEQK